MVARTGMQRMEEDGQPGNIRSSRGKDVWMCVCAQESLYSSMWRGRGYVDRRGIRRCTSNMCNRRDARDIDMRIWDDNVQKKKKTPRAVRRASKVRYAMVIYGVGKFQHGIGLHQGTLPAWKGSTGQSSGCLCRATPRRRLPFRRLSRRRCNVKTDRKPSSAQLLRGCRSRNRLRSSRTRAR